MMPHGRSAHHSGTPRCHPCAKLRIAFARRYAILARSMTQVAPAAIAQAEGEAARAAPPQRAGRRWRRALLWGLLIALLAVAEVLLVLLAVNYETTRAQDRTEAVAAATAAHARATRARGSAP